MSAAEKLLERLERVRQTGADQWIASCPGPNHENGDRHPSLSIKECDGKVLLYCFSQCDKEAILSAIGLELKDLFDEPLTHHGKPLSKWKRKRHSQAMDALKALSHETYIVEAATHQLMAGTPVTGDDGKRLWQAIGRIRAAREVV